MKHLLRALALEAQQKAGTQAQQTAGTFHRPDRPRALRGWLTVHEVAVQLRFTETALDPDDAARKWLRRHRVPTVKRGRIILVDQFDIDHILEASTRGRPVDTD